jgi:FixJ family two-component response regulator
MPMMSGEETLARLQSLRSDVPVILSSGFSEREIERRFEGRGAAGFIQKPYRSAALLEKVQAVMSDA